MKDRNDAKKAKNGGLERGAKRSGLIHLVWHYPVVCQTPKEDFFRICREAGGGEIVPVKGARLVGIIRKTWRRDVHAQGRGFPFPEAACLFAGRSVYSPHNDTLGSRWYTRAVRRFLYNRYGRIISQTEYGRQNLIRQGIRKEKIEALPIPVDCGFFSKPKGGAAFRRKHGLGSEPFAIAVGIRHVKNPAVILEACGMAGIRAVMVGPYTKEGANTTWKGGGFDWYLPERSLLNHPNAVFVGQLEAGELLAAMDAATIFVCSSDYESFGLAAYEAAAAGLPLCLPKYGPGRSLGTFDGFRGCALFHEPGDAKSLAGNIIKYLRNPKLRSEYGRRAMEKARGYDYTKVRRLYEEFYAGFFGSVQPSSKPGSPQASGTSAPS